MRFKFNLRCMELICIKEEKWQRRIEQTLKKKKLEQREMTNPSQEKI